MGVPNASGDVWVAGVVGKVLFLFRTHPTVEITSKDVIVMTMEVLWGMWGGNMEIVVEGSVEVLSGTIQKNLQGQSWHGVLN